MTESSVKYKLKTSKVYIEDYGEITTYGLQSTNLSNNITIEDISTIKDKVINFIELCNKYCVSPTILEDVLEDYMS